MYNVQINYQVVAMVMASSNNWCQVDTWYQLGIKLTPWLWHHTHAHTIDGGKYLVGWPPGKIIRAHKLTQITYGALSNSTYLLFLLTNVYCNIKGTTYTDVNCNNKGTTYTDVFLVGESKTFQRLREIEHTWVVPWSHGQLRHWEVLWQIEKFPAQTSTTYDK